MPETKYTSITVRKLADKSDGERVKAHNPFTGESHLVDPVTNRIAPWPLLGVIMEIAPEHATIPTSWVSRGVDEGWISVENPTHVVKPAGPPASPWRDQHVFVHCTEIVIHCIEGDVRYRVVHQPDKYQDEDGWRVDWFYLAELV